MKNIIEIQLPFEGFYCSIWDNLIESTEDQELEWIYEENKTTEKMQSSFSDYYWRHVEYSDSRLAICEKYVSHYADFLSEILGEKVGLEYSDMVSPKEYNFTTDRLFARVDLEVMKKILALPQVQAALPDMLIRNHKSRDGFISFMACHLDDGCWTDPVEEWDCNQWKTVLDCLFLDDDKHNEWIMDLYEDCSCNGTVDLGIQTMYEEWLAEYNAEIAFDNEQFSKIETAISAILKPEYKNDFLVVNTLMQNLTRDCEELEVRYLHTMSGNQEKIVLSDILGTDF